MNYNDTKSIKNFGFVITIIFGISLLSFLLPIIFSFVSVILKLDILSVDLKNFHWFQTITFLIITIGLLLSGYSIIKVNKWGFVSFVILFTANILAKILYIWKEFSNIATFSLFGILLTFIIDVILIIYAIKVFSRKK